MQAASKRGGAPVGYLEELGPVEAGAVMYLRLWCEGSDAQSMIWQDFLAWLGDEHGEAAVRAFEQICDVCINHGRRPLMRHSVSCKCLGADESWFAHFIGCASDGEHEDAVMMACTIVRPALAKTLVKMAEEFGGALKLITVNAQRIEEHAPISATVH